MQQAEHSSWQAPCSTHEILAELQATAFGSLAKLSRSEPFWSHLADVYATPPRAYHHLGHVLVVARRLMPYAAALNQAGEVYAAVLFHDAIYRPGHSDNERDSAALARAELSQLNARDLELQRVSELIELTARHGGLTRSELSRDAALFLDADTAILGAPADAYATYARNIAEEYGFLPTTLYREKRAQFLSGLLQRTQVFLTPEFEAEFGMPARRNLRWEIELLRS